MKIFKINFELILAVVRYSLINLINVIQNKNDLIEKILDAYLLLLLHLKKQRVRNIKIHNINKLNAKLKFKSNQTWAKKIKEFIEKDICHPNFVYCDLLSH